MRASSPMCEVRLSSASGSEAVARRPSSPVRENGATGGAASCCHSRALPRYRVLREVSPRGGPRSVDRECAGRNAKSVKDVEPRQTTNSVVAERVWSKPGNRHSEGSTSRKAGTIGVRDHSMYTRQVAVRLRSAAALVDSSRPRPATDEEGLRPYFSAMAPQKSDALIVASKRVNARGAKGGTVSESAKATARTSKEGLMFAHVDSNGIREAAVRRAPRVFAGFRTPGVGAHQQGAGECSARKHQPKSRMREIRTSGSVRGGGR